MAYNYIFLAEAQEEYENAINWYLERSIIAAEGLVSGVNNALSLICDHPDRWRNEYADYFEVSVKKYPFSIIYLKDDKNNLILIVSLYHHKKDPKHKYKK